MKYYVIYVSNGALQVDKITEWSDLNSATTKFYNVCATLSNAEDVIKANVKILDEQLDVVSDYSATIVHDVKA